jgi:integrase/recombinase XerC
MGSANRFSINCAGSGPHSGYGDFRSSGRIEPASTLSTTPRTVRAYHDDLSQFLQWLESIRVDWNNPRRLDKTDVEAFMHNLSDRHLTGVSRARKLAAIRKFLAFLHENGVLQTNPASTVKGARREEKEPAILY